MFSLDGVANGVRSEIFAQIQENNIFAIATPPLVVASVALLGAAGDLFIAARNGLGRRDHP